MNPQLCCFIMCDDVQQQEGKFSLQGVFFRVHVASFPCLHNCHLAIGWYGEEGQHAFALRFMDPANCELQSMPPYTFSLSREKPYSNTIIKAGLPLVREGIYWFEVLVNGILCGRFPLHVYLKPAGLEQ